MREETVQAEPVRGRAVRAGRRAPVLAVAAALLVVAGTGGRARAQSQADTDTTRNLDLSIFRPVHGVDPTMLTVETPEVGRPGSFALDVSLDLAKNPLLVEADGGQMIDRPISTRVSAELAAAYAFAGRFEVSAVMPLLLQDGSAPMFSGVAPASGGAVGDLRLHGRAFIARRAPLSFGASAEVTVPTATDDEFAGAAGPTAEARGLVSYDEGRVSLALDAGALMRQAARLADVEQGHQVVYGAAAAYQITRRLRGIGEAFGSVDLGGGTAGGKPLEVEIGARYRLSRELGLTAGLGRGVLPGLGAPEVRLFAGVSYAAGARPIGWTALEREAAIDRDGDGLAGDDDECPDAPEDLDGFQDSDGCPDFDNDGDGVPDDQDRCPDEAEDVDRFQDGDGCPDSDNDTDGVPDTSDRCPDEPEDKDGYADDDGCPDPDNDHDGIADVQDRCPDQAETINGNDDDDGCPDKGDSLVLVTADGIDMFEPIRFRGSGAELTRSSARVLGQLGATLRANPEIARVRIRAYVQHRGDGDDALSVKRAEAVRRWLVGWGVEPSRLEGAGFGSRKPLVKGDGAEARRLNDRIEIEIVQRRPPVPGSERGAGGR